MTSSCGVFSGENGLSWQNLIAAELQKATSSSLGSGFAEVVSREYFCHELNQAV
jgi:hypothetical protein